MAGKLEMRLTYVGHGKTIIGANGYDLHSKRKMPPVEYIAEFNSAELERI